MAVSYTADLTLNQSRDLKNLLDNIWENVELCPEGALGPLAAVDHGCVIGGLAFTLYPIPEPLPQADTEALWINALAVAPGYQGNGIASHLIRNAEQQAIEAGADVLYVYTDIPGLYLKLGWQKREDYDRNMVLSKYLRD